MSDDDDDLLGDLNATQPSKRKAGRPRKVATTVPLARPAPAPKQDVTAEQKAALLRATAKPMPHQTEFRKPVGITFLADVVGKQPKQIAKALGPCPVKEWTKGTRPQPLYDFMEAIAYLVVPAGDIEAFLAQKNTANLPPYINKMWWDSAAQRNRVLKESNDLWHTQDVMVVFGRVANSIRQRTKMWIEELPEKDKLTDEQYKALVDAKDRLLNEIRETLIEMPRQTLSMTDHIRSELETAKSAPPVEEDEGDNE